MVRRAAVLAVATVLPGPGRDRVDLEDPALARVRRQMSRGAYLAALAVRDALARAGPEVDPARTAAFLALGASNGALDDVLRILAASTAEGEPPRLDPARFARRGVAACNPLLAFQLMNNFTLCHAAIREGLQGPSGAFYGADSAAHALREGLRALADVPWALVAAADSLLHPVTRFERAQAGVHGPPGEGAVVLLLAREAANPLAWVEVGEPGRGQPAASGAAAAAGLPPGASVAPVPSGRRCDLGAAAPAFAWARAVAAARARPVRAWAAGAEFVHDPRGPAAPARSVRKAAGTPR